MTAAQRQCSMRANSAELDSRSGQGQGQGPRRLKVRASAGHPAGPQLPGSVRNAAERLQPIEAGHLDVGRSKSPLRSQSAMAGSLAHERPASANRPAKTTRVRINSISEQIQDPNWLIRMSQELEEAQQRGSSLNFKKSHLRALHRKLKSTITGVPVAAPSAPSLEPEPAPVSMPATPVKAPVSILKQRVPGAQRAVRTAPPPAPTPAAVQQHKMQPNPARPVRTRAPATPSIDTRPAAIVAPSVQIAPSAAQKAATVVTSSPAPVTSEAPTKPVPICADGQVRVSGWKRNNLLAKTLSHFDEIRGNQRPVFVHTKILLPLQVDQTSKQRASPKFAEVVREALSKKSLLVQDSPAGSSTSPTPPTALPLGTGFAATVGKRTSDSEQSSQQPRCASAIDWPCSARSQDQQRSNSVTQQLASPQHQTRQQVVVSLNRPGVQTSLATPELMSQLLSASENSAAAGGSSSRLFKLQHKNQQVLQNLRHELEVSRADGSSGGVAGGSSSRPPGGSVRIKDWKRLTGKLSLLTGHRSSQPSSQSDQADVNVPLRLTHSNVESSSTRTSTALQVPGQPRKLSSSSLVVQSSSVKTTGRSSVTDSHSATSSPLLSAVAADLPRRRSDSEAYQHPGASGVGNASPSRPVVVNRKDLLHLLQVTGSSGRRASLELRRSGSARSRWTRRGSKRRSLQLGERALSVGQVIRSPLRSGSLDRSLDRLAAGAVAEAEKQPPVTCQRPLDLRGVVAKTSRVALFQQKLRRIRWHKGQRKQPQQPPSDPPTHSQAISDPKPPGSGTKAAAIDDVFMDPTLIGDAIEIFLRSTMQGSALSEAEKSSVAETSPADKTTSSSEQQQPERLIGQ